MMGNIGNWVLGGSAAILGIAGLFVASHAGHGVGYWGGLMAFLFGVGFVMLLVKTGFDRH